MDRGLPRFDSARVLVAGDVMLDRYWSGETARISPEAPVPVVRVQQVQEFPGGAANVARNIAALGGHATLLGLCGTDEAGQTLARLLAAAGIRALLHPDTARQTITKLRVLSRHQQLLRLDFETRYPPLARDPLPEAVRSHLADVAVLVLSDYGKGTLARPRELIECARAAAVPVLVDPKGSDYTRYAGATLITPNRQEFEALAGPCDSEHELCRRAAALARELGLQALLITRGEQGMTLVPADGPELNLPARAREVYDVTGAGDTVIAVVAASLASGAGLAEAVTLANLAAGIVVAKVGTAVVSIEELGHAHGNGRTVARGVHNEQRVLELVRAARERGERIVMSNGCFDILHAGHVSYLEQARTLGDRLLVAVNDDASVGRLKGPGRPINRVEHRMAVLSALASVDWVCAFAEDTPERLLELVQPDVLVKGGDYRPEQVVGAQRVAQWGGVVQVLDLVEDCSSSALIERIRS